MAKAKITKRMTPDQQQAAFVAMAAEVGADEAPCAMDRAFGKINPKAKRAPKPAKSK